MFYVVWVSVGVWMWVDVCALKTLASSKICAVAYKCYLTNISIEQKLECSILYSKNRNFTIGMYTCVCVCVCVCSLLMTRATPGDLFVFNFIPE